MNRYHIGILFIVAGLAQGCSKTSVGPEVPTGASVKFGQVRDILVESNTMGSGISKLDDAKNYESKFPQGAAAILDKSVVVVFGKALRETATAENAEIIAYEAKAPKEGGWVVKENGMIYQMTAVEFAAKAPKQTKK